MKHFLGLYISRKDEVSPLRARLAAYEEGKRCAGEHCGACENALVVAIPGYYGPGCYSSTSILCALDVACPDFQRKKEDAKCFCT